MREIKFRAWDKENNKMAYWDDLKMMGFCLIERLGEIMQYTGLKDKNSKEIYEGDILTVWMEGWKQVDPYVVEDLRKLYFDCKTSDNYMRINDKEIIGNIYENKDLLK